MIPSTMFALQAPPGPEASPPTLAPAMEALLALLLGAVAGTILAFPQARVLRHHVARAWLWLPANALAWALGMVVIFRSAGTLPPSAGPVGLLTWVLLTITFAGGLVGAVHGLGLVLLLRRSVPTSLPQGRGEPGTVPSGPGSS
jgi:hypothetical protein